MQTPIPTRDQLLDAGFNEVQTDLITPLFYNARSSETFTPTWIFQLAATAIIVAIAGIYATIWYTHDNASDKFEQLQATTSANTAELARLNDKIDALSANLDDKIDALSANFDDRFDALSETTNQILQHLLSSTQP